MGDPFEPKVKPERLLTEVEDVLRTTPTLQDLRRGTPESIAWSGRALAVVGQWDPIHVVVFEQRLQSMHAHVPMTSWPTVLQTLHRVRHDLIMLTAQPTSIAVDRGRVYDYFDEIRKAMELAHEDLLFADPYLDAEFVSRYLPHAAADVTIRLLCGKKRLATLLPAVDGFVAQHERRIAVRVTADFHDRYLFVDRAACYQSGASFKDGAKTTPTTLTQIIDAFPAMLETYERLWLAAQVERPAAGLPR